MLRNIKQIIKEVKKMANNQASVINAKTEQIKEIVDFIASNKKVSELFGTFIEGGGIIFLGISIACCYVGHGLKKG